MRKLNSTLGAVALVLTCQAPPALAATFHVDAQEDAVDAAPGDGVCLSPASVCTLRAAVMEANASAGTDVIQIPEGSYVLDVFDDDEWPDDPALAARGDLDVTDSLYVIGAGADVTSVSTLSQTQPVFAITAETTLFGFAVENSWSFRGLSGVGASSDLTVDSMLFRNLQSCCSFAAALGASGRLLVRHSRFVGNGGEIGGAIYTDGPTRIEDSSFEGNGGFAGVVYFSSWGPGGEALIVRSRFEGNSCGDHGCAVLGGHQREVVIRDSVIRGTDADRSVVHIRLGRIVNTTISDNGPFLAAVVTGFDRAAPVLIENSTIVDNHMLDPGVFDIVAIRNSIVARNITYNGTPAGPAEGPFTSLGHNLFDVIRPSETIDPTDLAGTLEAPLDAGLSASLGDHGGPTETHALLYGSPAVDAGDPDTCSAFDARGVGRPQDGNGDGVANCDIGAVERLPAACDPAIDCEGAPAPPRRACGLGGELLLALATARSVRGLSRS